MKTATKKESSFQIALGELEREDGIGIEGIKAMKVCQAADVMLRACKDALACLNTACMEDEGINQNSDVGGAIMALQAAISKATA
jgi:hypothetical protein